MTRAAFKTALLATAILLPLAAIAQTTPPATGAPLPAVGASPTPTNTPTTATSGASIATPPQIGAAASSPPPTTQIPTTGTESPLARVKALAADLLVQQLTVDEAQTREKIATALASAAAADRRYHELLSGTDTVAPETPARSTGNSTSATLPTSAAADYAVALIRQRGQSFEAILARNGEPDLIVHPGDALPGGARIASITDKAVTVTQAHGRRTLPYVTPHDPQIELPSVLAGGAPAEDFTPGATAAGNTTNSSPAPTTRPVPAPPAPAPAPGARY